MPDACPIMKSVDDNDLDAQYQHLLLCKMCRMYRASVDFHPSQGWDTSFSFDLMLEPLSECYQSRFSENPKFNNGPLVNRRYEVDKFGGIFIVPGKSSHSTTRLPKSPLLKFRDSAGVQTASCFLLLKLTSNIQAGTGSIFVPIKSFNSDANIVFDALKKFTNNPLPLAHFNKAVAVLKVYCRKTPSNIIPSEKLSVCGMRLFNEIYNKSALVFCSSCTEPCNVNKDLVNVMEQLIKMYISMNPTPSTRLRTVLGSDFINHFLTHCDVSTTHVTLKSNQNFVFPIQLIE